MKWSELEIKFIKNNFGILSKKEIADKLQRTISSISFKAKQLSLTKKNPKLWTEEKIKKLCKDWYNLDKKQLLAKYPNYKYENLRVIANINGGKKNIKLTHKMALKKLIDTSNLINWYWYGFLVGDGTFNHKRNSIKITASKKDYLHIKKFADYLNINVRTYIQNSGFNKNGYICEVSVHDAINFSKLEKFLGINGPKTYNAINFDFIKTKEQLFAFLIGLIDSDGYIGLKGKNIIKIQLHTNWYNSLLQLKNLLINYDINSISVLLEKSNNYPTFYIYRHRNFKILYDFAKINNLPYLERKWSRLDYLYNT